jgi:hypothetical protein
MGKQNREQIFLLRKCYRDITEILQRGKSWYKVQIENGFSNRYVTFLNVACDFFHIIPADQKRIPVVLTVKNDFSRFQTVYYAGL